MLERKWHGSNLHLYEIQECMDRSETINITDAFVMNSFTLNKMIWRNPTLQYFDHLIINLDKKCTLPELADLYFTLCDGGFDAYNKCVHLFSKKYKLVIADELQNGTILLFNSNGDIVFEFEDTSCYH